MKELVQTVTKAYNEYKPELSNVLSNSVPSENPRETWYANYISFESIDDSVYELGYGNN